MSFSSMCYRACCVVVAFSGLLFSSVAAEVRTITIDQAVSGSGEAASAVLVISSTNGLIDVVPAVALSSSNKDEYLVVGRVSIAASVESLSSVAVVFSKSGEVSSGYRNIASLGAEPVLLLDRHALNERLAERRTTLAKLELQLKAQQGALSRLQDDADVIANVNKIVNVEDELVSAVAETQRIKAALAVARQRINALKDRSVPRDYKRREAELVANLNELSTALKTTEASALQRVAAASADMQQKLSLIESTKGKQVDVLQAELIKVRREREQIERDLGGRQ